MGQIIKLPVPASKLGYRRVKRRADTSENRDQLHLFPQRTAQILNFVPALSPFEHALMLDERGDLKAAELYAKAIEAEDCVADAYCNLGIIESRKGNTTKAFDCFTTSLKSNPRHLEAHYNLGNLYFDLNDFRLAQIHYEMSSEVDPSFANAYFNLALVQAINNDPSGAIRALSKYQELVCEEEGRIAGELLQNLKKSLAAARNPRFGST
jgi:tetratricopeptide (TPR) repeat protein